MLDNFKHVVKSYKYQRKQPCFCYAWICELILIEIIAGAAKNGGRKFARKAGHRQHSAKTLEVSSRGVQRQVQLECRVGVQGVDEGRGHSDWVAERLCAEQAE